MIKADNNIDNIKKEITSYKGKNVQVCLNLGRNKIITYCGIINEVYNSLFKICCSDKDFKGKTAYSYSEVLCGNVKIKLDETV